MAIWRKVIPCWVTKAIRICSVYCFPRHKRLHEHIKTSRYIYIHYQSCLINIYTFRLHHREHRVIPLERTFNLFTVRIEVKGKRTKLQSNKHI